MLVTGSGEGKEPFFLAPSAAVCQQGLENRNQNYQNNLSLPKSFWLWVWTHFCRNKSTRKYPVPTLTKREVERNQCKVHKHRKSGSFSMALELLLEQLPQWNILYNGGFSQKRFVPKSLGFASFSSLALPSLTKVCLGPQPAAEWTFSWDLPCFSGLLLANYILNP